MLILKRRRDWQSGDCQMQNKLLQWSIQTTWEVVLLRKPFESPCTETSPRHHRIKYYEQDHHHIRIHRRKRSIIIKRIRNHSEHSLSREKSINKQSDWKDDNNVKWKYNVINGNQIKEKHVSNSQCRASATRAWCKPMILPQVAVDVPIYQDGTAPSGYGCDCLREFVYNSSILHSSISPLLLCCCCRCHRQGVIDVPHV